MATVRMGLGPDDGPERVSAGAREPDGPVPLDRRRWYSANAPSAAVPDGLSDEVIRAIWAGER